MPLPHVTITSVEFHNFKAFTQYSVKLQHMNVLVGPNNCGKSTILSAFRALAAGIRRARAKSPELVTGPRREEWGYRIPTESLPLSIENVHTDSIQNITLTQLARNRRVLFVEGVDDFVILRRFAQRVGFTELSAGIDLTPVESGGFSSWERIRGLAWGIEKTSGQSLRIGAIFDRDYWSSEELAAIQADLDGSLDFAHIHGRKEIENYLLVPAVLERACRVLLNERAARTGEPVPELEDVRQILDQITKADRNRLQSQYIARRTQFLQNQRRDSASVTAETIEIFETKWSDLDTRMEIVAGKDVLAQFRTEMQTRYSISLTDHRIVSEFRADDIPSDLLEL